MGPKRSQIDNFSYQFDFFLGPIRVPSERGPRPVPIGATKAAARMHLYHTKTIELGLNRLKIRVKLRPILNLINVLADQVKLANPIWKR